MYDFSKAAFWLVISWSRHVKYYFVCLLFPYSTGNAQWWDSSKPCLSKGALHNAAAITHTLTCARRGNCIKNIYESIYSQPPIIFDNEQWLESQAQRSARRLAKVFALDSIGSSQQLTIIDVPVILQLIKELAIYENALDEVKATHESLLQTIAFAPTPDVSPANTTPSTGDLPSPTRPSRTILVFTPEGKPAGMALYFYNYSTWSSRPGIYLEDLFVRESERNHGYGQMLLGELAKEVVEMEGGRLEWSVLKWNKPSIDFYERIGARAMTEWMTMRVDGEGLKDLAKRALP